MGQHRFFNQILKNCLALDNIHRFIKPQNIGKTEEELEDHHYFQVNDDADIVYL